MVFRRNRPIHKLNEHGSCVEIREFRTIVGQERLGLVIAEQIAVISDCGLRRRPQGCHDVRDSPGVGIYREVNLITGSFPHQPNHGVGNPHDFRDFDANVIEL